MSSIKCPVCGKEVSPFTRIHCGRPLSASQPAPLNLTAAEQVDIGNKTPTSNSSVSHSASSFFDRINFAIFTLRCDPSKKNRFIWILTVLFALCLLGFATITGLTNNGTLANKDFAKDMAKKEVLETWQEVDKEFALVGITFDSVKVDTLSNYEKQVYLDECSNIGFIDADGTRYKNEQAYYKAIGYDINAHPWRLYVVKGTYHVNNGKGEDYEGYYTVWVRTTKSWSIEKTEIELPTELQP